MRGDGFKMLAILLIVSQIESEDWLVKLKDAYFHISILPEHTEFLRMAFEKLISGSSFWPNSLTLYLHKLY